MSRLFLLLMFLTLSTFSHAKPLVVTTFSILGDLVHEIGQDKIEIKSLVGPNQDSHVYEPRPQDAKELGRADLIVVNGLGFEGWLDRLIDASGFHGKILVATTGIHPYTRMINGKTTVDPHAWHSLQNAYIYIDNIVRGLSELLPNERSFFKTRARSYKKALNSLEKKTQQKLKSVPVENRKVITGHDGFSYLGRDFNITFYSPLGISTDAEPSAKSVAKLIHKIQEENIQALFVENISNPRLLEQISNETGTHIGGILYSDALSPPGTEADTYLKMMLFNLSSIYQALAEPKES